MLARTARRSLSSAVAVAAAGCCLLLAAADLAAAGEEEALRARAESGDGAAQLALALALESSGAREEAARWYARAAARGEARAQYFLGQLYETGTGVPRAPDRARAWYEAASGALPAAGERRGGAAGAGGAPAPVAPELQVVAATERTLDVVWTSAAQPDGAVFHVAAIPSAPAAAPVAVAVTPLTAVVLPVPPEAELCCVRVVAVDLAAMRYAASDWAALGGPVPPWAGVEVVLLPEGVMAAAIAAEAASELAGAGIAARVADADALQGDDASHVRYRYAEDRTHAEAVAAAMPGALPVERVAPGRGEPAPPGRIEVRLVTEDAEEPGP